MNGVTDMTNKQDKKPIFKKITKIGNSIGISIPKDMADKLGWGLGDEVVLVENDHQIVIKKKVEVPSNVRPEVMEAFYHVFHKHKDVFQRLKDQ